LFREKSTVLANEELAPGFWKMRLVAPGIAAATKPGQFVNIKVTRCKDPLFRRPFTVFRCSDFGGGNIGIELVYEIVGRGTRVMSDMRKGEELDLIGPLGRGFECRHDKRVHILVGSGVGLPALFMLGEELSLAAGRRELELVIMIDAKTKKRLILEEEFRSLNGKTMISIHDGGYGYHGYVTEMLRTYIDEEGIAADCAIYACGPELMFKAMVPICSQYNVPAQISMERNMGCGVGACLSCVCRVNKEAVMKYRDIRSSHVQFEDEGNSGYALVCRDGPVFNIDEVIFDE
jgi:dihydroorotate dehydrogenase electron transfer subunit